MDYDAIVGDLRARRVRLTPTRRAVVEVLVSARSHVTADDVADAVRRRLPDVHDSTIYRTLEALERLGVIDHVHLGHGRAVYHLAQNTHHHLVCDRCASVVELPDELFTELATAVRRRYGFALRSKHFALLGTCRGCSTRRD